VTPDPHASPSLSADSEAARLLFDTCPLPVWVFDLETLAFLTVNDAAVRRYGYSRDEFLAMTIGDIRPKEDVEPLLAELAVTPGPDQVRHSRHRKKNGEVIEVEVYAQRLVFAGRPAELVAVNDVTQHQRMLEALRASEERARLIVDKALAAVVGMDAQGAITEWNPQAEKLFGWSRQEALGRRLAETIIPAHYREAHRRGLERFLATGEGTLLNQRVEVQALHRDGHEFPVEVLLSVIPHVDGPTFNAFMQDITERKRSELQIWRLNRDLERRAHELLALNHELEAFTYSVSHDLRAPLRHIDGFSRILLEQHGSGLDASAQRYLELICQATVQMGALIDSLLNLSRVTRKELTLQPTDFGELVQEVIDALACDMGGRQVEWTIGALPRAACDTALMRQVLQNLLSNALKFTKPRAKAQIEVGEMEMDGERAVFVRDNGVGFNMKYVDKLFGAFQRLHRQDEFEGTGVGLAIVQRIIHKHGGRVWAEAEPGGGATFWFTYGARAERPIEKAS
jgi:PAS domain S-box-containing protein